MRTNILVFVILSFAFHLCISSPAASQILGKNFRLTPYFDLKSFGWKEFDDNDNELLSESGAQFGLGFIPRYIFTKDKKFYGETDFHIYFGKVDYNGFLQGQDPFGQPTREPYNSKSNYFGIEFIANSGYKLPLSKKFYLIPIGGFGIEYWHRDLDDGGQYGYDEYYTAILFNLAGDAEYTMNRDIQFLSSLSIKIPISISESIDMGSRSPGKPTDISLSPGISPRIYFSAGSSIYKFLFSIYFETWVLTKSNEDQNFHQPESARKFFGVKLGYNL